MRKKIKCGSACESVYKMRKLADGIRPTVVTIGTKVLRCNGHRGLGGIYQSTLFVVISKSYVCLIVFTLHVLVLGFRCC